MYVVVEAVWCTENDVAESATWMKSWLVDFLGVHRQQWLNFLVGASGACTVCP